MTTLHLIYSSLKCVFNDKSSIVYILKRKKQIKNILNTCYLLPNVINNIVYQYTDELIELECSVGIRENNIISFFFIMHDDFMGYLQIKTTCPHSTRMPLSFINNTGQEIIYNLYIDRIHTNIVRIKYYNTYDYINKFNIIMKHYYMRDNYINYKYESNTRMGYSICKNIITYSYTDYSLTTFEIINYSKLTYLIVIMKCLINGIDKYLKTYNFYE